MERTPRRRPAERTAPLLLLVVLLVALVAVPATAGQHPVLALGETAHDVGTVPVGETIETQFVLRNAGDAALEISRTKASCRCTVAEVESPIAPGKSGTVRLRVDTAGFDGPIVQSVVLYTNDPAQRHLELAVQADVRPYLEVRPGVARHLFGQKAVEQNLWATDGQDFEVLRVDSPSPYVEATFHRATDDERLPEGPASQWRIETAVRDDAPPGTIAGRLVIETDHPKQQRVEVVLTAVVRPPEP